MKYVNSISNMMMILQVISCILLIILSVDGINRSAYKISLTQKGYTQFLAYDLETPAIKEFTFCTWIRIFSLENDQTIFSYVGKHKVRIVKMWLESGGHNLKVTINNRAYSILPVYWKVDVWKHVCMSYQSGEGAWAIYIDGNLEQCEVAQSIVGFALPAEGSIIIGYGRSESNLPNGLEGEIFGFYMILSSTIKGNFTAVPTSQVLFTKNKILDNKHINYVVLGDLITAKTSDVYKESIDSTMNNIRQSHVKISTPHSFVDHDVGKLNLMKNIREINNQQDSDMDIFDFDSEVDNNTNGLKMKFWNLINKAGNEGKFKKQHTTQSSVTTYNSVIPSVFETPPPISKNRITEHNTNFSEQNADNEQKNYRQHNEVNYNIEPDFSKHMTYSLPDVETPPPINNNVNNNNVFGQWSSINFANRVLSFIRNGNKDKKIIPATIPLKKTSDSYPYPSDFKVMTVKPLNIVRPNSGHYKIRIITKRQAISPEINVRIQSTVREDILQEHLENEAKNVIVTSRGETNFDIHNNKSISSSNTESQGNNENNKFRYNRSNMDRNPHNLTLKSIFHKDNFDTILPSIRTFENDLKMGHRYHLSNDSKINKYLKRNKWHNVKTYNNDYSPRHLNFPYITNDKNILNEENTPIGRNLKKDHQKFIMNKNDDQEVIRGRILASYVANQANRPVKIKYFQSDDQLKVPTVSANENDDKKVNFDKNVKLGNVLDEKKIIGSSSSERKRSFLGGNDEVPDINPYRSDIDKEKVSIVPPSLRPRVCNSEGGNGRILYVHTDGTVDSSHIISPIQSKGIGILFVKENYKNCLLDGTTIQDNPFIFIDWSKTPVRLFGGARPKITKDICGFF